MKRHLILLFSALAAIATAQGVPHNMVSRHTPVNTNLIGAVIGEGLSLSNGVLSSTGGGGGTDGRAVTNIVKGILADATNGMVKVEAGQLNLNDAEISAAGATLGFLAVGDLRAGGAAAFYGGDGDEYELAVKGDIPDLNNYDGDIHTGGSIDAGEISVQGVSVATQADLAPYARSASLGTAAYRDASEFATAADEALVYQLITNRLSGVTFDFATVAGLYLAISNIVTAQGGAITNFPAIP